MLTSLFGDLVGAARTSGASERNDSGFAVTAILDSVASAVNARGQIIDRHSRDLVVTGSPAQAIRDHFASTRSDLDAASALITLLDPVGMWASAVIKALSDAGGHPIERLHLREQTTLRTLAMIERTTLLRRHEDTLRIVHADVREPGSESGEIPVALMERSQMTTVVIGPLQPHAIDGLIATLLHASMLPTWRCPNLLFLLPPNAVWIANKISAVAWPARLHVHVLSESISGASAVWNAMLGMWNRIKVRPGWEPSTTAPPAAGGEVVPKWRDLGTLGRSAADDEPPQIVRLTRPAIDPVRVRLALAGMRAVEGLLACAVVDGHDGMVLAHETPDDADLDIDLVATTAAQVLRAHRQAGAGTGLADQVEEIVTSAGTRQLLIRVVARMPDLFILALLHRPRSNLVLAQCQLAELERRLS